MEEAHDLGYGLRKEFWNRGIVTEATKTVIEQVKKDGLPYITATHDKNNPRSGSVMKKLGMKFWKNLLLNIYQKKRNQN